MVKKQVAGLQADQAEQKPLKAAQKHFRKLSDIVLKAIFIAIVFGIGYFGGAGLIDRDQSGERTIGGVYMEDGSWTVIPGHKGANLVPDYGVFWVKRSYLECSYSRFGGGVTILYWIGETLQSSRDLTHIEELQFDEFARGALKNTPIHMDMTGYKAASSKGTASLTKGCPMTLFD